jgi:mRNA interferase MazF
MKTGDIILIPFPFSELTQIKVRPAVVVAVIKDKYNDLVLAAISSQVASTITANEIIIEPENTNGLRIRSVIKVDRIFTLKKEKIILKMGRLDTTQLQTFKAIFKSLVEQ